MDSKLYSKASIIVEADSRREALTFDDALWQEFFRKNTLGIPLAKTVHYRLGDLNDDGISYLNETWLDLCKLVMVDSDEEYEFLDDMLEIGAM